MSWSPDGLYLVSAHAMNGGGPTAQIIEREEWRCNKDFVGHRKAVTCVVEINFKSLMNLFRCVIFQIIAFLFNSIKAFSPIDFKTTGFGEKILLFGDWIS